MIDIFSQPPSLTFSSLGPSHLSMLPKVLYSGQKNLCCNPAIIDCFERKAIVWRRTNPNPAQPREQGLLLKITTSKYRVGWGGSGQDRVALVYINNHIYFLLA